MRPPAKLGMKTLMQQIRPSHPPRPRRTALSIPAINQRALEKAHALQADVLIFDLEDSVAEEKKAEARDNLKRHFASLAVPHAAETVIRINAVDTAHLEPDLEAALACNPCALLLPKVESPRDVFAVADRLAERDAPPHLRLWAMIETPKAVLHAGRIAEAAETAASRLEAFVIGLNDLRKETGVLPEPGRTHLLSFMMQILLAGRAYGLTVLDSVSNAFRDMAAFEMECAQGRAMGFDGKMLIHPAQIEPANRHFGPSEDALAEARGIIAAFALPEAQGLGVVNMDGRMVERLHLEQALQLVALADEIEKRKVSR